MIKYMKNPSSALKYGTIFLYLLILDCNISKTGNFKSVLSSEKNKTLIKKDNQEQDISTLNRAIFTSRFQIDPIFATSIKESSLLHDLFLGLMRFNEKGEVVDGIAQDWQTENGQIWFIHLKPNYTWSNNEPVTGQDFVASWQRLASHKNQSLLSDYLIYMGVKNAQAVISGQKPVTELGVTALNENTLKIELDKINYQLPLMLSHTALLPTFKGLQPKLNEPIITNGDYKIKAIDNNKITLIATNPSFSFKKVIYHRLNERQKINHYDLIDNPINEEFPNIIKLPTLCNYFYEFNFADPIMKNKNIRKAIKGMFSSNKTLSQFGIPNSSLLPNNLIIDSYSQWKPIVVESLLEREGINTNHPLHITLTIDNQSKHKKIADNLLRTLSRSDLFKIKLNIVEWQDLLKLRATQKFQMIRSGWCADYPDPAQFLVQYHSQSTDNKISYKNKKVDHLLEELKSEPLTSIKRNPLIAKIVQQLEEDIVILPLFQYNSSISVNPAIKGIDHQNISGVIYSKDLYK